MSCGFNFNTLPAMPLNATWASVPIAASHQIPYAQISLPCASPSPCPAPCAFPKNKFSQCAQPLPAFPVSQCAQPLPAFPVSQCAQPLPALPVSQCAQPLPSFPVSQCAQPLPAFPVSQCAQPLPSFPVSRCAQPLPAFPVSRCANPIPVLPVSAPLQIPFQFQTSEYRPEIPRCPTQFSAQIPAYPVNSQFLLPLSVSSCRSPCARRCC